LVEVQAGTNTVQIGGSAALIFANVDLVLVGAGGVVGVAAPTSSACPALPGPRCSSLMTFEGAHDAAAGLTDRAIGFTTTRRETAPPPPRSVMHLGREALEHLARRAGEVSNCGTSTTSPL
jgi:hypothetical protein